MYRVLLPVDGDEDRAMSIARMVANLPGEPSDIEGIVLNVFEEFEERDDMGAANSDDLFDVAEPPDTADMVVDYLSERDIESRSLFEHGDTVDVILEVAVEEEVDLITISGRRRSPAGKVIFGSVTQDVLLNSDRPVAVTMER